MQALRNELLPPSGVEFAACLKLLPSTVSESSGSRTTTRALFNVVVARSHFLRVFEVREEPAPISTQKDDERERRASVRKGTEAVEGEVEMDTSGEGFVNLGSVKVNLDTQYPVSSHVFQRNAMFAFQPVAACHNLPIRKLTTRYIVLVRRPGCNSTKSEPLLLSSRTSTTRNRDRDGESTDSIVTRRQTRPTTGLVQGRKGICHAFFAQLRSTHAMTDCAVRMVR